MTPDDFERFSQLISRRDEEHAKRQDRFEQAISKSMDKLADQMGRLSDSVITMTAENKNIREDIHRFEEHQKKQGAELRELKEKIIPDLDKKVEKNSDIRRGILWVSTIVVGVIITAWLGMQINQITKKDEITTAIERLAKSIEEGKK